MKTAVLPYLFPMENKNRDARRAVCFPPGRLFCYSILLTSRRIRVKPHPASDAKSFSSCMNGGVWSMKKSVRGQCLDCAHRGSLGLGRSNDSNRSGSFGQGMGTAPAMIRLACSSSSVEAVRSTNVTVELFYRVRDRQRSRIACLVLPSLKSAWPRLGRY